MIERVKKLIDEKQLQERIKEIADQISEDYNNEELILICILKGAAYFAIDLSKNIKNENLIIDFMKVSSYGLNNRESTGNINFSLDISQSIDGKNVIIVEDIVDSGITLNYLYNYLKKQNPKSLKICVLLDKKERREKDVKVDYKGFEIENKFVLGYGLDYDEKYRSIPYIGYVE